MVNFGAGIANVFVKTYLTLKTSWVANHTNTKVPAV